MTEPAAAPELAGMALHNGVLMLGPTQWAVAVREEDGSISTVVRARPTDGERLVRQVPLLRGPVRLTNMMRVLPRMRRATPSARFGFESREMLAGMLIGGVAARVVRARFGRGAAAELVAGVASLAITLLAMRSGDVAAYHGAEHKTIGGHEHNIDPALAPKEHPRCGTQLALPMIAFTTAATQGALLLAPGQPRVARAAGQLVGIAAATEFFRAAQKGNGSSIGRAAAALGIKLQAVATTAEPDEAQLAVAAAALEALLTAERQAAA